MKKQKKSLDLFIMRYAHLLQTNGLRYGMNRNSRMQFYRNWDWLNKAMENRLKLEGLKNETL